jgi:hypothetical protein
MYPPGAFVSSNMLDLSSSSGNRFRSTTTILLLFVVLGCYCEQTVAFVVVPAADQHQQKFLISTTTAYRSSHLFMGGFNKAQNKQAELARKMQLAKTKAQNDDNPQQEASPLTNNNNNPDDIIDPEEVKRLEERSEFAKLLLAKKNYQPPPPEPTSSWSAESTFTQSTSFGQRRPPPTTDMPHIHKVRAKDLKKSKKRKQSAVEAESEETEKRLLCLQEGDIAQRRHFEKLIALESSQPLGAMEAAMLVPWVPPYIHNYLVVLADPRKQSSDLRQSIQYLTSSSSSSNLEPAIPLSQIIVISADPVREITRYVSKQPTNQPSPRSGV